MRVAVAIDEPVGWAHSWISNGHKLHFNNSKVEVGLLIWAGIDKDGWLDLVKLEMDSILCVTGFTFIIMFKMKMHSQW